ncbi:MAG: hypothetical protein F4Y39_20740 [Gemmatimonadetes bacterium]|nr:hypothetical protein [Gemmatimonadota bacterium]MYC16159.1 hypothetical protein [Gemmatimonadota bacterium]MYD59693.1 hypothetical protein [Gemmatimonadota bacterium]MYK53120.1 hypothetical protein [Gemmatimonadota bacterium]
MTKISILPIPTDRGDLSYHAIAGKTYALGKTAIDEQTELEKLVEVKLHASEDRATKSFRIG